MKGYRKCRKCGERKRWPDEFPLVRTGSGERSVFCSGCRKDPIKRTCASCGKRRRIGTEIKPNGTVCLFCKRERKRAYDQRYYAEHRDRIIERVQRWGEENPERVADYRRISYERVRSDPKRWQDHLISNRFSRRLTGRTAEGTTNRHKATTIEGWNAPTKGTHNGTLMDAEPLAEWLRFEFQDWPVTDLARRFKVDASGLGRMLDGRYKTVSLHVADQICVAADCTHMLALLYPDVG